MKQELNGTESLDELFALYDDNLLNYFAGMSPSESKRFNKMIKDNKRRKNWNLTWIPNN